MTRKTTTRPASSTVKGAPRADNRMRAELLFLAPDHETSRRIANALRGEHSVRVVANTTLLRQAMVVGGADLLIVDQAAVHEGSVNQLCRSIRLTSSVAIIVLIDEDDPDRRTKALEAGADDCFCRALGTRELKARVSGLLRRAAFGAGALSMGRRFRFEGWTIDPHRRLLLDPNGRTVDLTAAEFDLLWGFCRHSGKTLSRATLLTFTRVGGARPIERSIDVHVSRLRSKIEQDPHHPLLLKTVRLGGYVFTPLVEADLQPEMDSPRRFSAPL